MLDTLEIEYACDAEGDHTANMAECLDTSIKKFASEEAMHAFIAECTYVYNLDIALGNKINAGTPHPVLDTLENCYV